MKVLKGTLRETRFSFPASGSAPKVIKETVYQENEVTYMADELGLHKISNPDPERLAVSLHRTCYSFWNNFFKQHPGYRRDCYLEYVLIYG